jgi:hypothetical protein
MQSQSLSSWGIGSKALRVLSILCPPYSLHSKRRGQVQKGNLFLIAAFVWDLASVNRKLGEG